ncbi:FAD-binding oxidoreductase [Jannaschia sp. KMU-145]|uniref:FAD-binding oxidoreductase n=1 Tax=Jannaschia halovivens TaxID=3388667 RepID=UPI00396B1B5C
MSGPDWDGLRRDLGQLLAPAAPHHRTELRGRATGTAEWVATPRDTDEVARVVRASAAARVPMVPYGGGTGLVGGQVGDGPPALVVSLTRMAAIRAVWPDEGAIEVEAGAILATVQEAAQAAGLAFPLTLGSRGSAQIGGLLATNAGGTAVLRHGTMRDLTLGVEAVLSDGSVVSGGRRLRKNNTGYDLRHLLIGSEGTLGIITAATLRLVPEPRARAAAFLAVASPRAALDLLAIARARVGEGVSGCELIDGQGLRWLAEHLPAVRQPFDAAPDWSVLMEIGLFEGDAAAVLEEIAADGLARGLVSDGAVSRSEAQRDAFWQVREGIPEASRAVGPIASHDVSVPLSHVPRLIAEGRAALLGIAPDLRFNTFGHAGDGNVHFNVFPARGRTRADYAGIAPELTARLHDIVVDLGGAISAEHGIGRFKAAELARLAKPSELAAMRAIKAALDPGGLMNPGVIFAAGAGPTPPDAA